MKRFLLCTLAVLMVASAAASAQPRYTLTWLGNLGWADTYVNGVNDSGQIMGYSFKYIPSIDRWREHAFVWHDGVTQDLGTLGSDNAKSLAHGINNNGDVVGFSEDEHGHLRPFLWEDGSMQAIPNCPGESARAINDAGQVIAYGGYHSYLWENGQVTDLGSLGGQDTHALAINDSGLVVGHSQTPLQNGPDHAFIWKQGRMTDLGTLGGPQSVATGINNVGQMVGYSNYLVGNDTAYHAFLWEDWMMRDLGTLGGANSRALDINDLGQVLGEYDGGSFVWQDGTMYDLRECLHDPADVGSGGLSGKAINNLGQIVGRGTNPVTGQSEFLLLNPVPEPSSLLVIAGGLVSLAVFRRRTA